MPVGSRSTAVQRRTFLGAVGASAGAFAVAGRPVRAATDSGRIEQLVFDSTASLLNADGDPVAADAGYVAVRAESTASNTNADGNGGAEAAVSYPADRPIPLVAAADGVVGFGAPIVSDDAEFNAGNEEFVLSVLDDVVGSGTVLWDDSHGQYYNSGRHSEFIDYANGNGYDVAGTDDLLADLPDADGVVVTSASESFTAAELDALSSFDGGVLLFTQSDYSDYDATANMNEVAAALGAPFRFNDDQVVDDANNAGVPFVPVTDRFDPDFDYFADRPGLDFEIDPSKTYTVDVVSVTDGDTVDVRFPSGYEDTVRLVGIDSPEVPAARDAELAEEWEGVESYDYLGQQGTASSAFATQALGGATVDLTFDPNEPLRGDYGRLLGYVAYDADGDGGRDTDYATRAVSAGRARVYDSGASRHDDLLKRELRARFEGRGVWAQSDPEASSEIRNGPVDELFAPEAATVATADGRIDDERVPVYAESSAEQRGGSVRYDDLPLVGVDADSRVAMVATPLLDDDYEQSQGFPADTSGYGNFAFVTNLLDALSMRPGAVVNDGGHGQSGVPLGLDGEDLPFYMRYLEGVDTGLEQVNDLGSGILRLGKALLVTAPAEPFTDDDLDRVRSFVRRGGAVILVGGALPAAQRRHLNDVAAALCSDLRLNDDRVVDPASNLAGRETIPVTSNFDDDYRLFSPAGGHGRGSGDDGEDDDSENGRGRSDSPLSGGRGYGRGGVCRADGHGNGSENGGGKPGRGNDGDWPPGNGSDGDWPPGRDDGDWPPGNGTGSGWFDNESDGQSGRGGDSDDESSLVGGLLG